MPEQSWNAKLDHIYSRKEFPLGAAHRQGNQTFVFTKYNSGDGSVTGIAGKLVIGLDSAYPSWECTMDYSSATVAAIAHTPRGFLQAALTDETYGWVQTWGPNRKDMLTDGDVTQGQQLMKHATTDGAVDSHDETAEVVVAEALEADDASSLLQEGYAFIKIME